MTTRTWIGAGVGAALVLVAGAVFLWHRQTVPVAMPSKSRQHIHPVAHHPQHTVSGTVPHQTAPLSVAIGTVSWLDMMRTDLSTHLHGRAVPPLWAAPWPNHPYGWVILDPLAQNGQLWYGLVAKAQPTAPEWVRVPANLKHVTTAQLDALPWPMKQALSLVYDVQNGLPYPVAVSPNALTMAGPGQANWDSMEANPPGNPVGWSLQWQPAYPSLPATLTVNVILPWNVQEDATGQRTTVWLAMQAGFTSRTTITVNPVGYVLDTSSLAQAAEPPTPAQGLVSSTTP